MSNLLVYCSRLVLYLIGILIFDVSVFDFVGAISRNFPIAQNDRAF